MKTRLLFTSLAILALFVNCKNSEYPEIEKAFAKYVDENFGDPDDLEEITSIQFKDTVSLQRMRDELDEGIKKMEQIFKKDHDQFFWWTSESYKYSWKDILWEVFYEQCEKTNPKHSILIESASNARNVSRISSSVNEAYSHFIIKVRVKHDEKKTIEEYNAFKSENGEITIVKEYYSFNFKSEYREKLREAIDDFYSKLYDYELAVDEVSRIIDHLKEKGLKEKYRNEVEEDTIKSK